MNKTKLISKLIIWFLSVLVGWFSVTSFSMFILEEAIQSVGFSLFAVKECDSMTKIEVMYKANEMKNKIMSHYTCLRNLNPVSAWLSFDLYFESVEMQFTVYNIVYQ